MSRRNGGWTSGRAKRCLFCAALVRSVCFSAKLIAAAREGPGRGRRQGIAVRQRQTATFVCWRLRHPAALQPPGAPCDDGGSAVGPGLTSSSAAHLRWHTVIIYRWDSLLLYHSTLRPEASLSLCSMRRRRLGTCPVLVPPAPVALRVPDGTALPFRAVSTTPSLTVRRCSPAKLCCPGPVASRVETDRRTLEPV